MQTNDRISPAGEHHRTPMYGSVWLTLFMLLRDGRPPVRHLPLSDEESPSPRQ